MPKIKTIIKSGLAVALLFPMMALAQSATTGTWTGTVASVSGNAIAVKTANGNTYAVDASNAQVMRRSGAATQLSFIMPGQQIQVKGVMNGSIITATSIRDMSLESSSFTATVRAVNGNAFTLRIINMGPLTVMIGSQTVITKNGMPATASAIAVGQKVVVKGILDTPNKTVYATSISM
jgi:hypothetical protein